MAKDSFGHCTPDFEIAKKKIAELIALLS